MEDDDSGYVIHSIASMCSIFSDVSDTAPVVDPLRAKSEVDALHQQSLFGGMPVEKRDPEATIGDLIRNTDSSDAYGAEMLGSDEETAGDALTQKQRMHRRKRRLESDYRSISSVRIGLTVSFL